MPVLTDGQAAPAPELAVLSAAVHGPGPDGPKVFEALLQRMKTIDEHRARGLIDEVLAVLPQTARNLLEGMMKTETGQYKSEFFRKAVHEGEVRLLLAMLSARGIVVPDEARARIVECTDLDQLVEWGRRAATAESMNDVLG